MFNAIDLVCSFQGFSVVKGLPGSTARLIFVGSGGAQPRFRLACSACNKNAELAAANNRSPIIQVMQAEGKGALLSVAGVLGSERDEDDIQTSPWPW